MTAATATSPLMWHNIRSPFAKHNARRGLGDKQAVIRDNDVGSARVFISSNLPNWYPDAILRFETLTDLAAGWDGYGGIAVREEVATYANTVLSQIVTVQTPEASIVPMSHGGLQIEWHTIAADLELSFLAPYEIELAFNPVNGEPTEAIVNQDIGLLKELVAKLI